MPEATFRSIAKAALDLPQASSRAYARAGARLWLEKTSGSATLALFEGAHDIVYEPGLAWLSAQRRAAGRGDGVSP